MSSWLLDTTVGLLVAGGITFLLAAFLALALAIFVTERHDHHR